MSSAVNTFISPQLASPMPKVPIDLSTGQWAAEEKLDGHRLIVSVTEGARESLYAEGNAVTAWGRYGIVRILPQHITDVLQAFPVGVYDGELLAPGKRSYGVTELVNSNDLVYTIFDVLVIGETSAMDGTYDQRRECLVELFIQLPRTTSVVLATSTVVTSSEQMQALLKTVWDRDGEGLILKRRSAVYREGKRSKDWVKLKKLQTAVLTITGFEPSKGTKQNRGLYATVVLRDEQGHTTTVKTRNNAECEAFEAGGAAQAIGRKLRIEFQERTPDGSYRHPRWDRWEDE